MNWCDGESNPIILQHSAAFFFQRFDHSAALKTERKISHLNIAFGQCASVGTVMHYILVISARTRGEGSIFFYFVRTSLWKPITKYI